MAASREISAPADDLDAEIDRVLGRAVRKIETERKALEYRCLNPETGWTKTEQALLDAMNGRLSLDELATAVGDDSYNAHGQSCLPPSPSSAGFFGVNLGLATRSRRMRSEGLGAQGTRRMGRGLRGSP